MRLHIIISEKRKTVIIFLTGVISIKKTRSFKNEITMIGSIDCELLKKIINIFIK